MRGGGEKGGPDSPGTRELDKVGWDWKGKTARPCLDPKDQSYPHPSRTLPSGSLQSPASHPGHPRAADAEFTNRLGCKGVAWGGREVSSGPLGDSRSLTRPPTLGSGIPHARPQSCAQPLGAPAD